MSGEIEKFKEQTKKKTLKEIETIILEQKRKISQEKDFTTLSRLSIELTALQEIRDQKLRESGRLINKSHKASDKPELKSFDDYINSKK